ncbi:hypothetical protein HDU96_008499, partial [Phlyctochytrium bullatum]
MPILADPSPEHPVPPLSEATSTQRGLQGAKGSTLLPASSYLTVVAASEDEGVGRGSGEASAAVPE